MARLDGIKIDDSQMTLENLKTLFAEVFKDARLEHSVINPLFGYIFKANGCLENIRFFSSEVTAHYDEGTNRDYSGDTSEDPLTSLTIHLFPSPAGVLASTRNTSANFTKRHFIDNEDYEDKGNEGRIRNIRMLGETFIKLLNGGTDGGLSIAKKASPYRLFEHYVFSPSTAPGLDDVNLKLLVIHTYALEVIDRVDEFRIYLEAISGGLGDVQNVEHLVLSGEEREAFESLYISPSFDFPYSKIRQPVSNSSIPVYNRKTDEFIEEKKFSDCADIVILHLCNCIFFNDSTGKCSLDHLIKENISEEMSRLVEFYEKYDCRPFNITYEMRKDWSRVVQGLSDSEAFGCQGDYNPHAIRYVRGEAKNELKSGIVNIMGVLAKICSSEDVYKSIMSQDLISKDSIAEKFGRLLNGMSHENIEVMVYASDIGGISFNGMKDLSGSFEITFKLKNSQKSASMELCISKKRTAFIFVSMELNTDNLDVKTLKSLNVKSKNRILLPLLRRYADLIGNRSYILGKNLSYTFDIFYNHGILQTDGQKRDQLVILFESMDKNKNLDQASTKMVIENIVKSANLSNPSIREMFNPFTIYIEDLLAKMDGDEATETWLSLLRDRKQGMLELKELGDSWTEFIRASSIKMSSIYIDKYSYKVEDIIIILSVVKEKLLCLDLNLFCEDPQEFSKIVGDFLAGNAVLTKLSIRFDGLESEHISAVIGSIKGCIALKTLNISRNKLGIKGAEYLADALKVNCILTTLDISENCLGNKGSQCMADALKINNTLTTLNIYDNNFGCRCIEYISDALSVNNALKTLDISRNNFGIKGAQYMANFLKVNSTLTSLSISRNSLGDQGAQYIADVLKINNALKILDISWNDFGIKGARYFADVLKANNTLASLNISGNGLEDQGVQYIADALKVNNTLSNLNISFNNLGSKEAQYIADVLKANNTLATLNISGNSLGDQGVECLADALKANSTLTSLSISRNNLEDQGAKHLASALKVNNTLTTLDISENYWVAEGLEHLCSAIKDNQGLKELTTSLGYDEPFRGFDKRLKKLSKRNNFILNMYYDEDYYDDY